MHGVPGPGQRALRQLAGDADPGAHPVAVQPEGRDRRRRAGPTGPTGHTGYTFRADHANRGAADHRGGERAELADERRRIEPAVGEHEGDPERGRCQLVDDGPATATASLPLTNTGRAIGSGTRGLYRRKLAPVPTMPLR